MNKFDLTPFRNLSLAVFAGVVAAALIAQAGRTAQTSAERGTVLEWQGMVAQKSMLYLADARGGQVRAFILSPHPIPAGVAIARGRGGAVGLVVDGERLWVADGRRVFAHDARTLELQGSWDAPAGLTLVGLLPAAEGAPRVLAAGGIELVPGDKGQLAYVLPPQRTARPA